MSASFLSALALDLALLRIDAPAPSAALKPDADCVLTDVDAGCCTSVAVLERGSVRGKQDSRRLEVVATFWFSSPAGDLYQVVATLILTSHASPALAITSHEFPLFASDFDGSMAYVPRPVSASLPYIAPLGGRALRADYLGALMAETDPRAYCTSLRRAEPSRNMTFHRKTVVSHEAREWFVKAMNDISAATTPRGPVGSPVRPPA